MKTLLLIGFFVIVILISIYFYKASSTSSSPSPSPTPSLSPISFTENNDSLSTVLQTFSMVETYENPTPLPSQTPIVQATKNVSSPTPTINPVVVLNQKLRYKIVLDMMKIIYKKITGEIAPEQPTINNENELMLQLNRLSIKPVNILLKDYKENNKELASLFIIFLIASFWCKKKGYVTSFGEEISILRVPLEEEDTKNEMVVDGNVFINTTKIIRIFTKGNDKPFMIKQQFDNYIRSQKISDFTSEEQTMLIENQKMAYDLFYEKKIKIANKQHFTVKDLNDLYILIISTNGGWMV